MFKNKEGFKVPEVSFKIMDGGKWKTVTTHDIFAGKKVVLFALPGAFTPTCSSAHVPRYNALFPIFQKHGIDTVVCLSVNDTFIMNAWQKDQKAQNLMFLPDGNGEFSEKMGLLVDKSELGFGKRSWRYSMLVADGKIEKMFIEPNKPGDPFEVSDADTMLHYIAPNVRTPQEVAIFTKPGCPHCARAKKLLKDKRVVFEEIVLGENTPMQTLVAITGKQTVPQIFIAGKHIGGADELEKYFD